MSYRLVTLMGENLIVDAMPEPLPERFYDDPRIMGRPRCIFHEGRYFLSMTGDDRWFELDSELPPKGMRLARIEMMNGKPCRCFIEK